MELIALIGFFITILTIIIWSFIKGHQRAKEVKVINEKMDEIFSYPEIYTAKFFRFLSPGENQRDDIEILAESLNHVYAVHRHGGEVKKMFEHFCRAAGANCALDFKLKQIQTSSGNYTYSYWRASGVPAVCVNDIVSAVNY